MHFNSIESIENEFAGMDEITFIKKNINVQSEYLCIQDIDFRRQIQRNART